MITTAAMKESVRAAWSTVPAPPAEDLAMFDWGWGEQAALAFTNIAPTAVDIGSAGFLGCTPLQDIPPRAAAAYLGTYMLSLLQGLEYQEKIGLFHDVVTRAHLISCLTQPVFCQSVVPVLTPACRLVLATFCFYLISRQDLLVLTPEQVEILNLQAAHLDPDASGPPSPSH
jgi:hypothetical protein